MKALKPNIFIVCRAILMMALFSLYSENAFGISFTTDTLIVDGRTVHVQVKEESKENQFENGGSQEVDSLAGKVFRSKFFSGYGSFGYCLNKIKNESGILLIDEFIGRTYLKGNFNDFGLEFLAETQQNIWIGASYSRLNWKVNYSGYEEIFPDNFFKFESFDRRELSQINIFGTDVGGVLDTMKVDLLNLSFTDRLETFGVKLGTEILKKKSPQRTKFLGFFGVDYFRYISSKSSDFHFISSNSWSVSESGNFEKNNSGGIVHLECLAMRQLSKRLSFSYSAKYRCFVSSTFSKSSLLDFNKSGLSLGLKFSYKL